MNDEHKRLHGCWFHAAYEDAKIHYGDLLCFKPNGMASGYYFDLIWGEDPYGFEGDRLHVKPWVDARIVDVAQDKLILEREPGRVWSYRLLCQTEPEDEKCKKIDVHKPESLGVLFFDK